MNYTDTDAEWNITSSRSQDATIIEQLRQRQQQQTFTFSSSNCNSNNMNTNDQNEHWGVYVEGTISEVRDVK
jgi:hypothetical protein